MLINDLFDVCPLLDNVWSKFFLALGTEVLDLGAMWTAIIAKLIEKDIDFEFFVEDFAFVLSDILG